MPTPTLDRTLPPTVQPLQARPFPTVVQRTLASGQQVYFIPFGNQPVVEVMLLFTAGHSFEVQPGVDMLMASMLTEGTRNLTGLQLAQQLDGLGAFFNAAPGYEVSSLSMSCLHRTLQASLQLFSELVWEPAFAERQWELLRERRQQQLDVEEKKTAYQARRRLLQGLYGPHPYGFSMGKQELAAVSLQAIHQQHASYYSTAPFTVVVAGQFEPDAVQPLLEAVFAGKGQGSSLSTSRGMAAPPTAQQGLVQVSMPGNLQSSLRLGQPWVHRRHEHYHPLRLLLTVLGGYFGSRLMKNIREDKGYTYGIVASANGLKHSGMMTISTDVGNEFITPTLAEIHTEMRRLQEEKIAVAELEVAKGYLLGRLVSEQETPFQIAEILKNLLANELTTAEVTSSYQQIEALTPADLLLLAQRYLQPDGLLQVVAGGGA